jgi:murein DD-endopeptidase MepM/ murein hydrolase activator NlpD
LYFHLADIKVSAGEEVKKGHILDRVGSTARATGPHLFFGIRWHDARIDPHFVLEAPSKIPEVQEPSSKKHAPIKPVSYYHVASMVYRSPVPGRRPACVGARAVPVQGG